MDCCRRQSFSCGRDQHTKVATRLPNQRALASLRVCYDFVAVFAARACAGGDFLSLPAGASGRPTSSALPTTATPAAVVPMSPTTDESGSAATQRVGPPTSASHVTLFETLLGPATVTLAESGLQCRPSLAALMCSFALAMLPRLVQSRQRVRGRVLAAIAST